MGKKSKCIIENPNKTGQEMKKRVLAVGVLGSFCLLFFGYQWSKGNSDHCATGNWVSPSTNESLEILKDKIAILDRITTSSGWKDACNWNAINEKSILLECRILGSEEKSIRRFQCGNTNKIGYISKGIEPSDDRLVMYRVAESKIPGSN